MRALAAAFVLALLAAAPAPAARIRLLAVTDLHGHLEADTPGLAGTTRLPGDGVPAGGVEYLATHIRRLSSRHTLVVSAGDLVGGGPFLSAAFHDEPTVEAFNAIGLDAAGVGNHELDEGVAELRRLQEGGCHPVDGCADGTPFDGARFPFLAANVRLAGERKPVLPPYAILQAAGERIGFIGVTTRRTSFLIPPTFAAGLRFGPEARALNRSARALRRRGVRAIVALLHEGDFTALSSTIDECRGRSGPLEGIVRRTSPQVDLFLTGHSHVAYDCVIDHRRVTSAGSFGRYVTRVDLTVSPRTHDVVRVRADNSIVTHDVPRAADMTALIDRYRAIAAPIRRRVIGRLARSARRQRDRSRESSLGNLVADAQRAAGRADAAFVNHGTLRADLAAGRITFGEAFDVQPFGTRIVTMTLTGAKVMTLLKQQWCGQPVGRVLQPSATVRFTWRASVAAAILGRRCAGAPNPVTRLRVRGARVTPRRRYRVAVNSSMAGGASNYLVLRSGTRRTTGPEDTEALERYFAPSLDGERVTPPRTNRIARVP